MVAGANQQLHMAGTYYGTLPTNHLESCRADLRKTPGRTGRGDVPHRPVNQRVDWRQIAMKLTGGGRYEATIPRFGRRQWMPHSDSA